MLFNIEKPIEMPDWNLFCLLRIIADYFERFLFVYILSMLKNEIINPDARKLGGLFVNKNKVV